MRRVGNTKAKESDGFRKEGGVDYVRCCSRIRWDRKKREPSFLPRNP